jgi:hypothetical protein
MFEVREKVPTRDDCAEVDTLREQLPASIAPQTTATEAEFEFMLTTRTLNLVTESVKLPPLCNARTNFVRDVLLTM